VACTAACTLAFNPALVAAEFKHKEKLTKQKEKAWKYTQLLFNEQPESADG
jgi:hypothetical protein